MISPAPAYPERPVSEQKSVFDPDETGMREGIYNLCYQFNPNFWPTFFVRSNIRLGTQYYVGLLAISDDLSLLVELEPPRWRWNEDSRHWYNDGYHAKRRIPYQKPIAQLSPREVLSLFKEKKKEYEPCLDYQNIGLERIVWGKDTN